jgi:hypothetical protein
MPYYGGYGGTGGPAEWAAQKQQQEQENFQRIISLFLNLKQNQTEQDWKQKEYGATERRYADTAAREAKRDANTDRQYGLDVDKYNLDAAYKDATLRKNAEPKPEPTPEKVRIARALFPGNEAAAMDWLKKNETQPPPKVPEDSDSPGKRKVAYRKAMDALGREKLGKIAYYTGEKAKALTNALVNPNKRGEIEAEWDKNIEGIKSQYDLRAIELKAQYGDVLDDEPGPPKSDPYKIGEKKKSPKDGKTYEYMGNDKWRPIN